ncbi:hypothetical protein MTO96_020372 [Rhipicephalus appendiculatus]
MFAKRPPLPPAPISTPDLRRASELVVSLDEEDWKVLRKRGMRPGAPLVSPRRSSSIGKSFARFVTRPCRASSLALFVFAASAVAETNAAFRAWLSRRAQGLLFCHLASSKARAQEGKGRPSVTRPSPETDSAAVARQMGRPSVLYARAGLAGLLVLLLERRWRACARSCWALTPVRLCRGGTPERPPRLLLRPRH